MSAVLAPQPDPTGPFFPSSLHLPAFPQVAARLLRTFGDDRVGLETIAEIVGEDPALTAKVLRLANSARYSPGHTISRLRDAAAALGLDSLRNLALSACLAETFPTIAGLDVRAFWQHAVACAAHATLLARACDQDTETAHVAGLMLRVGEIIMLHTDAPGVADVEAHAHEPGSRFDWEHQRWHCTHTDVTAELARRWHFPAELVHAFGTCADPMAARPFSTLGGVLRCAEVMADALMEGADRMQALQHSVPALVTHLRIDQEWLAGKLATMADPRAEAEALLQR